MKRMIEKKDNKERKEIGVELNIIPLLAYLLRRLWIILLVGIVAGAVTYTAVKVLVQPTYRCSFTAYVNNKQMSSKSGTDYLTGSDVNAAKELVKTYSAVLKSNSILSSADEALDLDYTVKQLKTMVSTQIQDETQIIQVFVEAKSPEESYKITTAIAGVAPKIMANIVEGSSMKIVEYPQMPSSIYSPSYFRFTLLGFGVAVLLMTAFMVIRYLRNDTVTDEAEVESQFSVPVLGVIPDVNTTSNDKSGTYYNYYYQKPAKDKDAQDQNGGELPSEKA